MVTKKQEADQSDIELVEALTRYLTLSIEEVADWHFADAALQQDWDRPLVRVLRFFVGDSELTSPVEDDNQVSSAQGDLRCEPLRLVVSDALVDLRPEEDREVARDTETNDVDESSAVAA